MKISKNKIILLITITLTLAILIIYLYTLTFQKPKEEISEPDKIETITIDKEILTDTDLQKDISYFNNNFPKINKSFYIFMPKNCFDEKCQNTKEQVTDYASKNQMDVHFIDMNDTMVNFLSKYNTTSTTQVYNSQFTFTFKETSEMNEVQSKIKKWVENNKDNEKTSSISLSKTDSSLIPKLHSEIEDLKIMVEKNEVNSKSINTFLEKNKTVYDIFKFTKENKLMKEEDLKIVEKDIDYINDYYNKNMLEIKNKDIIDLQKEMMLLQNKQGDKLQNVLKKSVELVANNKNINKIIEDIINITSLTEENAKKLVQDYYRMETLSIFKTNIVGTPTIVYVEDGHEKMRIVVEGIDAEKIIMSMKSI